LIAKFYFAFSHKAYFAVNYGSFYCSQFGSFFRSSHTNAQLSTAVQKDKNDQFLIVWPSTVFEKNLL
ncbi:hypothetical protein, partial [Nostoc parmelioides]|uniref:hypothetical protein n=1 Tax=Nostoc parmelioides TaxID=1521621 RepID=UPI001A7EFBDE